MKPENSVPRSHSTKTHAPGIHQKAAVAAAPDTGPKAGPDPEPDPEWGPPARRNLALAQPKTAG